jgi:hypothetical protein
MIPCNLEGNSNVKGNTNVLNAPIAIRVHSLARGTPTSNESIADAI